MPNSFYEEKLAGRVVQKCVRGIVCMRPWRIMRSFVQVLFPLNATGSGLDRLLWCQHIYLKCRFGLPFLLEYMPDLLNIGSHRNDNHHNQQRKCKFPEAK